MMSVTTFQIVASDGSWMPNDILGSTSPCQFAHHRSRMGWPCFFCSNWVVTPHYNLFQDEACVEQCQMWMRWGIFSRGLIEVKSPGTEEIILVQMSLGNIRVICFSSIEICEKKRTSIPYFEVSGYLTCDTTTQILLNIMACSVVKGRDTSCHLAEDTIVLYASDFYAFGAVQTSLFLICYKQGRRLT